MKMNSGFTLVELMVVIGILGILLFTAIPAYQTWQKRAYGREATLMAKQILDGQILYYLDNNEFFPPVTDPIIIPKDSPASQETIDNIGLIKKAIKITIPVGHNLNYQFVNYGDSFQLTIWADFYLYKGNNFNALSANIDKTGMITTFPSSW